MEDSSSPTKHKKCPFCRMTSTGRFLRIPVCAICRDQLYDFLWASAVQAVVAVTFRLGGLVFLVEEVLLFSVLVLVKHRVTPPWERGTSHH
jgi:hypothetical protein